MTIHRLKHETPGLIDDVRLTSLEFEGLEVHVFHFRHRGELRRLRSECERIRTPQNIGSRIILTLSSSFDRRGARRGTVSPYSGVTSVFSSLKFRIVLFTTVLNHRQSRKLSRTTRMRTPHRGKERRYSHIQRECPPNNPVAEQKCMDTPVLPAVIGHNSCQRWSEPSPLPLLHHTPRPSHLRRLCNHYSQRVFCRGNLRKLPTDRIMEYPSDNMTGVLNRARNPRKSRHRWSRGKSPPSE